MSTLLSFGFLLVFALPLFAQEHQFGAYKGDDAEVRSALNYCDSVDDSVWQQQPRIFAELNVDSTTKAKDREWREFASKEEWEAAGRPTPLAFVWDTDEAIVRVTVVTRPFRVRSPVVAHQRVDYCYGTDTKLIRIRAVWYVPTFCEILFPCRLIGDQEFFLMRAQRPGITDWVFKANGEIGKLRNGKAVEDYFDPAYSLTVSDLHLKTSQDLAFSHGNSQSAPK
jgi:hypothetical protein